MISEKMAGVIAIIFVAAVLAGIYINQRPGQVSLTAEQSVQVAEQNRQADVASQLRAAEPGDLMIWTDGAVLGVERNLRESGYLFAVTTCNGGFVTRYKTSDLRLKVTEVIKYSAGSPEYAEAAYHFVRCQPLLFMWP